MNIISAIYGPIIAETVGTIFGLFMVLLFFIVRPLSEMIAWPIVILGMVLVLLTFGKTYKKIIHCTGFNSTTLLHWLLFPFFFIFSPFLFLLIKSLAILRPNDEMIENQTKISTRGETVFESTPQLILQLYIVLSTFNATGAQWFSIITSLLSFSIGNLEYFMGLRNKSGLRNLALYFPIFFLTSVFKVMSLSILATFTQIWSLFGVITTIFLCGVFVGPIGRRYNYSNFKTVTGQGTFNLHWLTLTALGKNATSTRTRTVYTYYFFLFYTIFLTTITLICNINPALVSIPSITGDIVWAELDVVKNITYLNIIVGCTIGIGALAFVVDYFLYEKPGCLIHEDLEKFKNPVRGYWAAFKLRPSNWIEMAKAGSQSKA